MLIIFSQKWFIIRNRLRIPWPTIPAPRKPVTISDEFPRVIFARNIIVSYFNFEKHVIHNSSSPLRAPLGLLNVKVKVKTAKKFCNSWSLPDLLEVLKHF